MDQAVVQELDLFEKANGSKSAVEQANRYTQRFKDIVGRENVPGGKRHHELLQ